MRDVLLAIRRLALVGVALSVVAMPLGAILLISSVSPDSGGDALGDIIGFGLGVGLVVLGVAGLILSGGLAVLAKRSAAAPVEIHGSRQLVLAAGLIVAGGQVVIGIALGGAAFLFVGLSVTFAAGFLVVAVASRLRGEFALAGVLALALLVPGVFILVTQASQNDGAARMRERSPLVFADMSVAIEAAAVAAPNGWAVATLAAKATDLATNDQVRFLPEALIGHPLRGTLVVDCAGQGRLEIVARDGDATVVLGTMPCSPEPQVVTFEIPDSAVHTGLPAYVGGIEVDPVDQGPTGGMSRAIMLVARSGTSDPDRDALVATFVAAFGTAAPR